MSHKLSALTINLAVVAVIAANALANILPFNNITTGEVSAALPALFTPAGYVFSIWGLIYLLLLIYSATVWRTAIAKREVILFTASCVLNASWLLAWHYFQIVISLVIMLGLWGCLAMLYQMATRTPRRTMRVTFSVYFGWISVATLANFAALLVHFDAADWLLSESTWTLILLGLAMGMGLIVAWLRGDVIFQLVLMWAAVGIQQAQSVTIIQQASLLAAAVALATAAYCFYKNRAPYTR